MSNNAPDYNNLAFEPAKTAGTMATIARDGKAVAIRCYIDNQHYFDLTLVDAPDKMDWFDAKIWCEERYCRLPMKHELEFIGKNLKAINKMLKSVGGKPMKAGTGPLPRVQVTLRGFCGWMTVPGTSTIRATASTFVRF